MISIRILTADPAITESCRPILDELIPDLYRIHSEPYDSAQIYIWDAESVRDIPQPLLLADGSIKLVIVSKDRLSSVRSSLPRQDVSFLNSPCSKASLRIMLDSIISGMELDSLASGQSSRLATDRDRILQKLLESNFKLQEFDRERTNFMVRAVHDIRVPLMAVHGYCDLLLAGQLGPVNSEQSRVLEKMTRSLTRLSGLADAMMDLGVGSGFSTRVELQSSSLETSIHQAVHEILPLAEQKQISLSLDLSIPSGTLLFDAGQMEQVLVNLLDNACKFTPRRGSIEIRGYSTEEQFVNGSCGGYRLDISDSGRGIPPERLERIFDEFTSYEGASDRSGAGLGLAICRMIVNAHHGRIWSASGNRGAVFSIVLPYAAARGESSSLALPMKAVV